MTSDPAIDGAPNEPPQLELEDAELEDDEDDEEPNPFASLRHARGPSALSRWSQAVLDSALGVRIAVSVSDETTLDRELSSLRQLVHERPAIGRAVS